MKKMIKKAFTLVELLVVIAILAVLATVSIVGYSSFTKKAKLSNDTSFITQLNGYVDNHKALNKGEDIVTPTQLVDALSEYGINVSKLVPASADCNFGFDVNQDKFVMFDADSNIVVPEDYDTKATTNKQDIFVFCDSESTKTKYQSTYGIYRQAGVTFTEPVQIVGSYDDGENTSEKIVYTNTSSDGKDVIIRTNGGTLVVNDTVEGNKQVHYGTADSAEITTANTSFHSYGYVNNTELKEGKVVAEDEGVIILKKAASATTAIEGNGGTVIVADNAEIEATSTTTGIGASLTALGYTVTTCEEGGTATLVAGEAVNEKKGKAYFAGGKGTESDPWLIATAEQFQNVTKFYGEYHYYKVADGVTTIDCSGWKRVYLQGSFDGNGVCLINVDDCLFEAVQGDTLTGMDALNGQKGGGVASEFKNTQCKISNMDVTCNIISTGNKAGLIRSAGQNIYIENVDIHGKVQAYCGAAYIGYGLGQFGVYQKGVNVTWTFKNCQADAIIQSTTENVGGFIVNEYSGTNGTITLDNSGFVGYMSQPKSYSEFKYVAIAVTSTISYQNDTNYSAIHTENKYVDSSKSVGYTVGTPAATSDGFGKIVSVDKVDGATSAIVNLTFRVDDGVVNVPLEEAAIEKDSKWCSSEILNAKVVWGASLNSHYDGETYYYQYDGNVVDAGGSSYIVITQYNANGVIIARSSLSLTDITKAN